MIWAGLLQSIMCMLQMYQKYHVHTHIYKHNYTKSYLLFLLRHCYRAVINYPSMMSFCSPSPRIVQPSTTLLAVLCWCAWGQEWKSKTIIVSHLKNDHQTLMISTFSISWTLIATGDPYGYVAINLYAYTKHTLSASWHRAAIRLALNESWTHWLIWCSCSVTG